MIDTPLVINGVNLADLKARFDAFEHEKAEVRKVIQKGAAEYISVAIDTAKGHLQSVLEAESTDDAEKFSILATEFLQNAKFVSNVSGIEYSLPYYDNQSDYYPDGDTYSNQLESGDNDFIDFKNPHINGLYSLLETMESDVSEWNTSYC